MRISANRLDRGFERYKEEFEQKGLEVLRSGQYVLGPEVKTFEEEFSRYIGKRYCIGVASGLDALRIAFWALNIGKDDEVIVQGNTYIASVMGITINGATPVFVEPDEYFNIDVNEIGKKITSRTKAILVVHLYGQAANMKPIIELTKKYNLRLVEDCAQSHGAMFGEKMTGAFGDIGCFSFYPSKNMGAFGDAGAVVTDSEELNRRIRMFRNYGSEKRYYNKVVGANSRLDEIQAAFLRVRLAHLQEINEERKKLCERYAKGIKNEKIKLPLIREGSTTVWHQYVIRCKNRDKLQQYLAEREIGTIIHYPIPPHLSEAYRSLKIEEGMLPITEKYAKEVLSLPLYTGMTFEEVDYVIAALNNF